jgi:hypothetical protein
VAGILLFCGVVLLGIGGLWGLDCVIAWLCRDALRFRFGFPAEYQISPEERLPPETRWVSLGMSKVGGLVTNTLSAAPLDEGLAFEMRSVFRYGLMRPAIVPWSALHHQTSPRLLGAPVVQLQIVEGAGDVVNTIEPGHVDPAWIPRMCGAVASAAGKRANANATDPPPGCS